MEQTVEQCDDAGGVGKNFVPFFERTIRSQYHWLTFITAVDDFVEQIGGFVVGGKITDFVDAKDASVGIAAQFAAALSIDHGDSSGARHAEIRIEALERGIQQRAFFEVAAYETVGDGDHFGGSRKA